MSEDAQSDKARGEVPEELQDRLDELGQHLVVEGQPEKHDDHEPDRADKEPRDG